MLSSARYALAIVALLTVSVMGCAIRERCGVPVGVTAACQCSNGAPGARSCLPDHTWGVCDCTGNIALPSPTSGTETVGETGGTKPTAGGAVSGSGGVVSGGGVMTDDDAGVLPIDGLDGGQSGGEMGSGGDMGSGGTIDAAMAADPYRGCAAASDCDSGGQCTITASFPTNVSVCAPACVDVGDCPVPAGTYEATVICDVGYCRLDCTPVLFAALLTCPGSMTCVAPLLGTAYCHAAP